jgi:hypothetical protein
MIAAEAQVFLGLKVHDAAASLQDIKILLRTISVSVSSFLPSIDAQMAEANEREDQKAAGEVMLTGTGEVESWNPNPLDRLIEEMRNPAHAASWWRQLTMILDKLANTDRDYQRSLAAKRLDAAVGPAPAVDMTGSPPTIEGTA